MTSIKNKIKRIGLYAGIFIVVVISSGGVAVMSKTDFKTPSGKFDVGTFSMEFEDSTRMETLGKGDQKRKLIVQFYYPSINQDKAEVPYTPNAETTENDIQELYGIPKPIIRRLTRSKIAVKLNAIPTEQIKPYPLLIFSHGWDGNRFQNSFLLPELASHGYVVVSVEHTYSASGTVFEDGSKGGVIPFERLINDPVFSQKAMDVWSTDQSFVLDQINSLMTKDTFPLRNLINPEKVGVFGHSFGGASAATTLVNDKRFKAGINYDGFYFGDAYKKGFSQPFMELRADNKKTDEMTPEDLDEWGMTSEKYQWLLFDEWNRRLIGLARNGYETIKLENANHMSFSDFPKMMPFSFITAPETENHHETIVDLTLGFFDKHLL